MWHTSRDPTLKITRIAFEEGKTPRRVAVLYFSETLMFRTCPGKGSQLRDRVLGPRDGIELRSTFLHFSPFEYASPEQ